MSERNDLAISLDRLSSYYYILYNKLDPYQITFMKPSPKVEAWSIQIERDDGWNQNPNT